MTTNQALTNERKPIRGDEPTNKQRRALIGGAMGGALVALLSSSGQVMARETDVPNDPFILLLKRCLSAGASWAQPWSVHGESI